MGGNRGLIDFLRAAVGYSLTADVREKCFFFLWGGGDNGKSTFVETVHALMGDDYWAKTRAETILEQKTHNSEALQALAMLLGVRFVSATELPEGSHLNEARVKDMTGQDTIPARHLYAKLFSFTPVFKVWMYGNHKPFVRGADEAIWRRIRLVPFTVTIPPDQQDRTLRDRLLGELPGILNWALRGCLDWQARGLPAPPEVSAAVSEYRGEMDLIPAFLRDCCRTDRPDIEPCRVSALYQAYTAWCEQRGEQPMGSRTFNRQLKARGVKQSRASSGHYVWKSIALLPSANGNGAAPGAHPLAAFDT
jgi:putative DNA primase/helicase